MVKNIYLTGLAFAVILMGLLNLGAIVWLFTQSPTVSDAIVAIISVAFSDILFFWVVGILNKNIFKK